MPISWTIPSAAAYRSRRTDARKIPGLRYDRKARCPPFPREPLWAKIQVSWSAKRKARQASASPLNGRPQSPRGDDDEASYSVLRPTGRQEPIPSPRGELWRCPRPNVVWCVHDVERDRCEFAQNFDVKFRHRLKLRRPHGRSSRVFSVSFYPQHLPAGSSGSRVLCCDR